MNNFNNKLAAVAVFIPPLILMLLGLGLLLNPPTQMEMLAAGFVLEVIATIWIMNEAKKFKDK